MATYTGKFIREAIPCGSITWPSQVARYGLKYSKIVAVREAVQKYVFICKGFNTLKNAYWIYYKLF